MAVPGTRERISAPYIKQISSVDPTLRVKRISGVRVHDIGQGDSISVLSETGMPFMQIDYGGRIGNPFATAADARMPIAADRLVMLSHWDEDHWCSAAKGTLARSASWLVPRQITSPRAVKFSLTVPRIHCVPEDRVGETLIFTTEHGDQIWWEKIAPAPAMGASQENCNHTGIAFSIVRTGDETKNDQVILLPGDAPYGEVGHYQEHLRLERQLRGLVAFHHGTNQHWTPSTIRLLKNLMPVSPPVEIVFSCARENSYGHPHRHMYAALPYRKKLRSTPAIRRSGMNHLDIIF